MSITRRDLIAAAATSSVGLLVADFSEVAVAKENLKEASGKLNSTFLLEHSLKPLPFDPKKLKGLSEKLIQSHWENNYGGSVKILSALRKKWLRRWPQKKLLRTYTMI